jgi:hypothetical protein
MTISRPVAGDNARPPRIISHDGLALPLVFLVDHAFTLPMVGHSAHPISEGIVRAGFILDSKARIEVLLFRRSLWSL